MEPTVQRGADRQSHHDRGRQDKPQVAVPANLAPHVRRLVVLLRHGASLAARKPKSDMDAMGGRSYLPFVVVECPISIPKSTRLASRPERHKDLIATPIRGAQWRDPEGPSLTMPLRGILPMDCPGHLPFVRDMPITARIGCLHL